MYCVPRGRRREDGVIGRDERCLGHYFLGSSLAHLRACMSTVYVDVPIRGIAYVYMTVCG